MKPKWLLAIVVLLMALLACRTPVASEPSFFYDTLPTGVSPSIENYMTISKWDKTNLSYYFVNESGDLAGDLEHQLIRQAFGIWSAVTPLTFNEVNDPSMADISIGWFIGDHGDGDPFDGPKNVLAHASFPSPYESLQLIMHFDEDENWVDSESLDVDLVTVAAHEIGHTLGLAHSYDVYALMYPKYQGPRRYLGDDDIAGVQSLYGDSGGVIPPPQGPQVPQAPTEIPLPGEEPKPSAGPDNDSDGISDEEERSITGTSPNNADTDADGLVDGVETNSMMNPLVADMDGDGILDGTEVNEGTDPFSAEMAPTIPADLEQQVSAFLTNAIELQIQAYQSGDANTVSSVMGGTALQNLTEEIISLNNTDMRVEYNIDWGKSKIFTIRQDSSVLIQVDVCGYWTTTYFRKSDGQSTGSTGEMLKPETFTIENINGGWFITNKTIQAAPAFCQ